jgi:hypothetical protein
MSIRYLLEVFSDTAALTQARPFLFHGRTGKMQISHHCAALILEIESSGSQCCATQPFAVRAFFVMLKS